MGRTRISSLPWTEGPFPTLPRGLGASLPSSRSDACSLLHSGCERAIVSFAFIRDPPSLAVGAPVDAVRASALFPAWRGARLLASGGTAHVKTDLICGICHGLLLGLHAAVDLGARVVEVYGPFHPKLAVMLLATPPPSIALSYPQLLVERLRSFKLCRGCG